MSYYENLDTRVFAVGFYDGEGVWFYTWERERQEQDYCYALAAGGGGELIARFTRPGHVYGEAKLADVISSGLPE